MRAPLRAIRSFNELVLKQNKEKLGPPGTDFLENSIRAAERLDRLIQDVVSDCSWNIRICWQLNCKPSGNSPGKRTFVF